MAEFSVSKLAEALKAVNDAGSTFLQQCMDSEPSGGKVTANVEPLRAALADAFIVLGSGADDLGSKQRIETHGVHGTVPGAAGIGGKDSEVKPGSQEKATGDKRVASDARHVGPSSPLFGTGYGDRGRLDTRFSIDSVFGANNGGATLDHSVDGVFNSAPKTKLAEG